MADGVPAPSGLGPGVAFAVAVSKIVQPLHRPRLVRRDRLLQAFAAIDPHVPLVLLVAPSGYGKTSALSHWAEETNARSVGSNSTNPTTIR